MSKLKKLQQREDALVVDWPTPLGLTIRGDVKVEISRLGYLRLYDLLPPFQSIALPPDAVERLYGYLKDLLEEREENVYEKAL